MKKQERTRYMMSMFVIVLMVLSVFSVMLYGFTQGGGSEGVSIRQAGNLWVMEHEGEEHFFVYHPSQLEGNVSEKILNMLEVYPNIVVSFDPNVSEPAYTDTARFALGNFFTKQGKSVINAVTKNSSDYSLPVIECGPLEGTLFITLKDDNVSDISVNDNCVKILSAYPHDRVMQSELIIYEVMGVYNG